MCTQFVSTRVLDILIYTRPQDAEELFNLRHAMLRNVVERIWGVIKMWFAVLRQPTQWPITAQAALGPALCAVHNFIRINDPSDLDISEDLTQSSMGQTEEIGVLSREITAGEKRHAAIAEEMWQDYISHWH